MFTQVLKKTGYGLATLLFATTMATTTLNARVASAAATNKLTRAAKVSFTFDDGLASAYKLAAPTLQKYGFTGTNYVISGCAGMTTTPNTCAADNDVPYMTWADITNLHNTYGWEIGSHTATHPYLASTDPQDQPVKLTPAQIVAELANSKTAIKANTGIDPVAFASPYGDYDPSGNPVLASVAKLYSSHRGFADTGYNITPYDGSALPANDYPLNSYLIRTQQVQAGVSVATVKGYVDKAIADNAWLVLTFHEIKNGNASNNAEDYQYNNSNLDLIAQYVSQKAVPVVNVTDGLPNGSNNLVNGSFDTPITAFTGTPSKTEWTTDAPDSIKNDSANNGSYPGSTNSIAISATAVNTHLFSPLVIVDPTKSYVLKIYVNVKSITAGAGNEVAFFVDEYSVDGTYLSTQYKKSIVAGDNPLVKNYIFQYTPTVNTGQARLQIDITANSGITGYVDSVEWYANDDSPVITPPTDTTAPVISLVTGVSQTTTGATIGWMTNEASTTQVEYGLDSGYGTGTAVDTNLSTVHSLNLTGLSAATAYHYRVISKDATGNIATSADYSFTTASIVTPPTTPANGDTNNDGIVDELDLSTVLSHWSQTGQTVQTGDFNNDGIVDELDLSIVLANWSNKV